MSSGSTTCLFYRDLGARRPSAWQNANAQTTETPRPGGVSDASEEKKVSSSNKSEVYNAVLKYLGTRGSPRWIILRKHPRVRGLPLPEPDTLWLVHTQKLSKNKTRTGPTIPQRRTATHHAQTESCALAGARLLSGRLAAGKHVPNPPEQNFVRNIHVHNCRGIVSCWGSLGALLSA